MQGQPGIDFLFCDHRTATDSLAAHFFLFPAHLVPEQFRPERVGEALVGADTVNTATLVVCQEGAAPGIEQANAFSSILGGFDVFPAKTAAIEPEVLVDATLLLP